MSSDSYSGTLEFTGNVQVSDQIKIRNDRDHCLKVAFGLSYLKK